MQRTSTAGHWRCYAVRLKIRGCWRQIIPNWTCNFRHRPGTSCGLASKNLSTRQMAYCPVHYQANLEALAARNCANLEHPAQAAWRSSQPWIRRCSDRSWPIHPPRGSGHCEESHDVILAATSGYGLLMFWWRRKSAAALHISSFHWRWGVNRLKTWRTPLKSLVSRRKLSNKVISTNIAAMIHELFSHFSNKLELLAL